MVVKSATKKRLMDLGIPEYMAHTLADNRKWDDVKYLTFEEVWNITWPILFLQLGLGGSEGDIQNQVKGKKMLYDMLIKIKQKIINNLWTYESWVLDRDEQRLLLEQPVGLRNRTESWWRVTLKENRHILSMGYNPFINWAKNYPFK
jgi:hypothetical protein